MKIKTFFLGVVFACVGFMTMAITKPPALYNFGLTCYIDALIQNLFNLPEFIAHIQEDTSAWGIELKKLFDDFAKGTEDELETVFGSIGLQKKSLVEQYKTLIALLKTSVFTGDLSKQLVWTQKIQQYENLDPREPVTYKKLDEDIGAFLCEKFQIVAEFFSPENIGAETVKKVVSRKLTSLEEDSLNQITDTKTKQIASKLKAFFPEVEKAGAHMQRLNLFIFALDLDRNAGDSSELFNTMVVSDTALQDLFSFDYQINYWCPDNGKYAQASQSSDSAISILVSVDKSKSTTTLDALLQKEFGIITMSDYRGFRDIPALMQEVKRAYVRESIQKTRNEARLTILKNTIEELQKESVIQKNTAGLCYQQLKINRLPEILTVVLKRNTEGYFYVIVKDEEKKKWREERALENIDLKKIPKNLKYEAIEFFKGIITIPLMLDLQPFLSTEAQKGVQEKTYQLVGGVIHFGGFHYYAVVQSIRDGFWYLCNDCPFPAVTKISEDNALERLSGKAGKGFATLLFYRKKSIVAGELKKVAKTNELFGGFAQALAAIS